MSLIYSKDVQNFDFYYGYWSNFSFIDNEAQSCKFQEKIIKNYKFLL